MVFQDGHAFEGETGDFRLPIVFDNLIAKKRNADHHRRHGRPWIQK